MMTSTPLTLPTKGHRTSPSNDSLLTDHLMRATAVMGLIAVCVIHFAQVVPTTEQTPRLGVAFIGLSVATASLAALFLHRGTRQLWWAAVTVNALAIGGYVFTRTVSSFLDNVDVGNWSEMLGVAALTIEGLLVALGLHALSVERRHEGAVDPSPTRPTPRPVTVSQWERRVPLAEVSNAFARELARR